MGKPILFLFNFKVALFVSQLDLKVASHIRLHCNTPKIIFTVVPVIKNIIQQSYGLGKTILSYCS